MAHHLLGSSVETCHWGFFDSTLRPVLTVKSGDTVTVETVTAEPGQIPPEGFDIPPELLEIHQHSERMSPGHILTGPIAIEGARAGQVLEVRILDVAIRQDWGFNLIVPLWGGLPDDFEHQRLAIIPLDLDKNVARMSWGTELPLKPFFGVMGVAPPANWGRISSLVPRSHAGNIDNKDLVAGSTLFLPIFTDGALFSCGDGHGAQGDGEVCVSAIETALRGTFQFILRDDLSLSYPRAETPSHYITMAMDPDLDQCAMVALRQMIVLIREKTNLSREDAYMLCSLAGDLRVTQIVNGSKGIHVMLEKSLLEGPHARDRAA